MQSTIAEKDAITGNPDELQFPLFWRSHPAGENIGKGIFALSVIIAMGICSALFMDSFVWGLFAMSVLFIGLARFFFPTDYAIDSAGIREKFLGNERVASWRQFRWVVVKNNEIFLSPFPKKHILDRFRGWFIKAPDEKTAKFLAEQIKG